VTGRVTLRDAAADDWQEIATVHRLARQKAYAAFLPATTLEAHLKRTGEDYWRERLPGILATDDLLLVAESGDGLIGFIHLSGIRVDRLYVTPPWWGRGVAETLMRAALDHATECGETHLVLETSLENGRARRFYARLGGCEGKTWDETFPDGATTGLVEVTWDLGRSQTPE